MALRAAIAHDGPAILPREPLKHGSRGADELLGDPAVLEAGRVPDEVAPAVAVVIETSGSSGVPKRVALSGDALLASAAASEGVLGGPGQWLLALPTHYIAGVQVLVRSIAASTTPLALPPGHFSAAQFAERAAELTEPLRFTSLVPAQLARLVEAAREDVGIQRAVARFDAILVGGQALPESLAARAADLGFRIVRTYGSSETAGGCVYDGRPIGRTRARVVNGELELTGPSLAEGYLGDEALTVDRFVVDEEGRWYRTNDGGTVTDGLVEVTGRLDNVIISGGVKVSLDRVERIVQSLPGFEQAVVVARPSEAWGQVAVVVVVRAASASAAAGAGAEGGRSAVGAAVGAEGVGSADAAASDALERVRRAVVEAAGRAAAPSAIVAVDRIPRLSSGKPDRLTLAAQTTP